jgi:two-component system NtrC family sensor kinase
LKDSKAETVVRRISEKCIATLRLRSIKGKIFTLFAISLMSIAALTALDFWNMSGLRSRLVLSERYDDLLNDILEVRRFEKNYFIYGDKQNLKEGMGYLDQIDELIGELEDDLLLLTGPESYTMFRATLSDYRKLFEGISDGRIILEAELRNVGKAMTVTADQFRITRRKRIHEAILRTSVIPIAFFCIFLPIMIFILWLISYGMLRPLNVVARTTRQVGRGNFSPIVYEGVHLEEISGLIEAFNSMAHELEVNQEDLIQARKIAAIGTFTAGIAHELNNPINNIMLSAEAFLDEHHTVMDSDCREMIDDIISQADRAADIVKNLLDFSRTENPSLAEIAPADIVTSSVKLLKNQIRMEKIGINLSMADNLPWVRGNLRNLQQVFTNLLLNALQASPTGGSISVSVDRSEQPGYVEFVVEDSGPGIPQENQHKIFEPFFSTKEVGKGTGLGLSVCYSIIRRHKGFIKITSEAGRGARFSVQLPAVSKGNSGDLEGRTAI